MLAAMLRKRRHQIVSWSFFFLRPKSQLCVCKYYSLLCQRLFNVTCLCHWNCLTLFTQKSIDEQNLLEGSFTTEHSVRNPRSVCISCTCCKRTGHASQRLQSSVFTCTASHGTAVLCDLVQCVFKKKQCMFNNVLGHRPHCLEYILYRTLLCL